MKTPQFTLLCAWLLLATMGQSQTNTVGTISYDPALAVDGYTLIYPHNQPHARLIDACGEVVTRALRGGAASPAVDVRQER